MPRAEGLLEERDMIRFIYGKVHGRTIELTEALGLAEGQEVEVQVKIRPPAAKWGEGIRRTAGALADDPQWDAVMESIYRERRLERRALAEEE
jgi:hypothetical protein